MRISVQLAHSKEQYEQAFQLLQDERRRRGLAGPEEGKFWVTKHHALPSTNTIVAIQKGEVVGAVTLFGESAFRLPLEEAVDLGPFRESLGNRRIAELSLTAVKEGQTLDTKLALHHYALCFGASYCHYDTLLRQEDGERPQLSQEYLAWEELSVRGRKSAKIYQRSAREGADLRKSFSPGFEAEFRFPEKKFFLVAHQSLEAETMDHLFNRRTQLFAALNDLELRVLKNFYDHGEYAAILPERKLDLPFKQLPKHRRFPMNCEGFLRKKDGRQMHLQVLDVSKEGIKLHTEDPLAPGSYALTLSIGVRKDSEIIANTVWIDELAQIAGLVVKSGDQNWRQLIEYLEQETLKAAA